jgi:hypothetical protein
VSSLGFQHLHRAPSARNKSMCTCNFHMRRWLCLIRLWCSAYLCCVFLPQCVSCCQASPTSHHPRITHCLGQQQSQTAAQSVWWSWRLESM